MSSVRSLSAGRRIGITLRRKNKSSRKPPSADTLAQIAIRRRDDPGVEDDGLSTTEAAMLLFLQGAQQLRLQADWYFSDFI